MAKDKLTDYDSTTASNNTDVGGISVAEGMLPSAVNNSIRELTKQLGAFADGTDGIDVLSLADDDASHAIKLQAPSAVTADTTFTLPDGDGVSGQTMITDGAGTLAWAAPYGNRNLIINGAMQVAQRYGYNSAQTDWNGYDASDRIFKRTSGSATSSVQTRDDDAPSGFSFSDKLTITSANSDTYIGRGTCLEWQNINHLRAGYSDAKTVTLSFWVKTSIAGTYCFALTSYASTHSGSNASTSYVREYTVNSANTWEYKTITITMPTSTPSNWDNSNGKNATGLRLQWTQSRAATANTYETATTDSWISGNYFCTSNQTNMGATNGSTFQITGVQLELGSTATPFEHRSYGDELARCQRYFWKPASSGWGGQYVNSSTNINFIYPYPVPMRTTPSTTVAGGFKFNKPGIAGDATATFGSNEKISNEVLSVNYGSASTTGSYGDTAVVSIGDISISAEL